MANEFANEKWKKLVYDVEHTNVLHLEVSNYGRIRSNNKINKNNILRGSLTKGYPAFNFQLYKPREEKVQKKFDALEKQKLKLAANVRELIKAKASKKDIKEANQNLATFKAELSEKYRAEVKSRAMRFSFLIHRLVAMYFLKKPKPNQVVVAHLDFVKTNNHVDNLKWITVEENYARQQINPNVLKERAERKSKPRAYSSLIKLNPTKVSQLKKMLNQKKPIKDIVEKYGISENQVHRIKRGENWSEVPAAK